MADEDIAIEVARTLRECLEKVEAKIRAQQTGDMFKDLPVQIVDIRPLMAATHD